MPMNQRKIRNLWRQKHEISTKGVGSSVQTVSVVSLAKERGGDGDGCRLNIERSGGRVRMRGHLIGCKARVTHVIQFPCMPRDLTRHQDPISLTDTKWIRSIPESLGSIHEYFMRRSQITQPVNSPSQNNMRSNVLLTCLKEIIP